MINDLIHAEVSFAGRLALAAYNLIRMRNLAWGSA